jgi:hypothetical protein
LILQSFAFYIKDKASLKVFRLASNVSMMGTAPGEKADCNANEMPWSNLLEKLILSDWKFWLPYILVKIH